QDLGRFEDGSHDLVVTGAAAEVASQVVADLSFGGIRIDVEESFGCHEKARGAEAALQRGFFEEDLLQRMQFGAASQAFDGFDDRILGLHRQHETGVYRPAVDDHGARTAVTVSTAFFGAREVQLLPQHLKQRLAGIRQKLALLPIEHGPDDHFTQHRPLLSPSLSRRPLPALTRPAECGARALTLNAYDTPRCRERPRWAGPR